MASSKRARYFDSSIPVVPSSTVSEKNNSKKLKWDVEGSCDDRITVATSNSESIRAVSNSVKPADTSPSHPPLLPRFANRGQPTECSTTTASPGMAGGKTKGRYHQKRAGNLGKLYESFDANHETATQKGAGLLKWSLKTNEEDHNKQSKEKRPRSDLQPDDIAAANYEGRRLHSGCSSGPSTRVSSFSTVNKSGSRHQTNVSTYGDNEVNSGDFTLPHKTVGRESWEERVEASEVRLMKTLAKKLAAADGEDNRADQWPSDTSSGNSVDRDGEDCNDGFTSESEGGTEDRPGKRKAGEDMCMVTSRRIKRNMKDVIGANEEAQKHAKHVRFEMDDNEYGDEGLNRLASECRQKNADGEEYFQTGSVKENGEDDEGTGSSFSGDDDNEDDHDTDDKDSAKNGGGILDMGDLRELERKLVGEKHWSLRGEVSAKNRPVNSLLDHTGIIFPKRKVPTDRDEDVEKEIAIRRAKSGEVSDEEMAAGESSTSLDPSAVTSYLNRLIKRRIAEGLFDNVETRTASKSNETEAKAEDFVDDLDTTKSKTVLADEYRNSKVDLRNSAERLEMEKRVLEAWGSLRSIFDGLVNHCYIPIPLDMQRGLIADEKSDDEEKIEKKSAKKRNRGSASSPLDARKTK